MPNYQAPLADMRFVMSEVADLAAVQSLPGYEDATDDIVNAILEEAGRFGGEVLAPLNPTGDRQGCSFENGVVCTPDGFVDAYRQFVESGWNSLGGDVEYGGQGLPHLLSTAVFEIWTAANMAFALCPMLTQAAIEALDAHGSDAIKEKFLPNLIAGTWTGTMNLTEPQAGSDLARVRTKAVPDGSGAYHLFGQKIFITHGEHDMAENIIHLVLARLPDAPEGVRGISLFLVPKFMVNDDGSLGSQNDCRCVSIEHKLGINGSPTAAMSFGDGDGAVGYLVGQENRGLEHMFTMMNQARLAVGVEGIGIADRAYQRAHAFAAERVQGRAIDGDDPAPVAIIHHPDVQRMLLAMKSRTEAARVLAYYAAGCIDIAKHHADAETRRQNQARFDLLTPVIKAWSTDIGVDVASIGIQVHGGMGYVEESGAPQHLRDARIAPIYEGTNGIQAMDLVSRKVGRDKAVAARALIDQMRAFLATLDDSGGDHIAVIKRRLSAGVDDLAAATDWLAEKYKSQPRQVAAGATLYLDLMGIVTGGWLMAKAALQAARALASGEGDPVFLRAKLLTARFFADTYLARSGALRVSFTEGGEVFEGLDPNASF